MERGQTLAVTFVDDERAFIRVEKLASSVVTAVSEVRC